LHLKYDLLFFKPLLSHSTCWHRYGAASSDPHSVEAALVMYLSMSSPAGGAGARQPPHFVLPHSPPPGGRVDLVVVGTRGGGGGGAGEMLRWGCTHLNSVYPYLASAWFQPLSV
jgi:hypothetical protein